MLGLLLQGCIGAIIGTTVDVAVEVIKIPVKVGGAVVDVVTGDDFSDGPASTGSDKFSAEAAARSLENQGL